VLRHDPAERPAPFHRRSKTPPIADTTHSLAHLTPAVGLSATVRPMLPIASARARIAAKTRRLALERVSLAEARGRVVGTAITAPIDIPRWDNSAMDGYAVRVADVPGTLPIASTIAAGAPPEGILAPRSTSKVMTGAPIPRGTEAIVMREDVGEGEREARFEQPAERGQHIRRAGEDIAAGSEALAAGALIGGGELGVLAALGITSLDVGRRPRVALVATGNELVALGTEPGPGQLVNSNSIALGAEVDAAGGVVTGDRMAGDDPDLLRQTMGDSLAECDVLLTMGGVSAGDFDFVRDVCPAVGIDIDFWKVAIKPGKPLVFGTTERGQLYFGLPGNPVSSMVVFELFVRPALLAMQGCGRIERTRAPVHLAAPYRKLPGRAHYLRASLTRDGERLRADVGRKQGSGMLSSMVGVDALIEIDAERTEVSTDETVTALLLAPV